MPDRIEAVRDFSDAIEIRRVEVDGVTIRYRDRGSGPAVVFVHGVWVGGAVWDDVADVLPNVRCIQPTWPLGAHRDPAPEVDLTARAAARRIPALLAALDLDDVTLVGNDTGGGLCLAALGCGHDGLSRIGRLVLTNCDSYEHFPPKGFDKIVALARRSPRIGAGLLRLSASRLGRAGFLRAVCTNPPSGARAREVFEAFPESAQSRRDALRVTSSLEPSVTLDAVPALKGFTRPVLLVWGNKDKLFPVEHARRLEKDFPNARVEVFEGARTFVMIDRPKQLADAIARFVEAPRTA